MPWRLNTPTGPERRVKVRAMLRQRPLRLIDLARATGVSRRTIRKDIAYGRLCLGWQFEVQRALYSGLPPQSRWFKLL